MPVNSFLNFPMSWKPEKRGDGKPYYISLANQLEEAIVTGKLSPNTMLPPQRELADYLDINLSTITRAFKLCELKGLIYAVVGRGTYVSPNAVLSYNNSSSIKPIAIDLSRIEPFNQTNHYINSAVQNILSRPFFNSTMEYNSEHSEIIHKYTACKLLNYLGINVQPENLLITAGSQNALSIILLSLFRAGDKIAVDSFTYHHFKTLANYLNLQLLPIPSDDAGMLPDRLANLCRLNNISGIYLMPGCNNPTSAKMPLERRYQLSDIILKNNLILIEDDSYAFLSDNHTLTFYELIPENSIYLMGTSKSFCAGLRVAFAVFSSQFSSKLNSGYTSINLRISPFDSEIVSELIMSDTYLKIFDEKKSLSRERNKLYSSILKEHNPYYNPYSFFRWLKLPEGLYCKDVITLANRQGVNVMGSNQFSIGPDTSNSYIRVALSTPETTEKLTQGLNIIYDIISSYPHLAI